MTGRALTAAILCLALRAGGEASAQEPRIFEGPGAWKHPESRQPTEQELLFNDRNAGGFQSRSFYFTAYLDDEVHVEISLFRWGYGLLGGWGLQVVTAESGGKPFVFEERIVPAAFKIGSHQTMFRFDGRVLPTRSFAFVFRTGQALPPVIVHPFSFVLDVRPRMVKKLRRASTAFILGSCVDSDSLISAA